MPLAIADELARLRAVVVGVLVLACGDTAGEPASTSACSSGPEYSAASEFEPGPTESSAPNCTHHCGDHTELAWGAGGRGPSVTAVPSGACASASARCQMNAVKPCAELESKGTLLLFECACEQGNWRCRASYIGGGACVPLPSRDGR